RAKLNQKSTSEYEELIKEHHGMMSGWYEEIAPRVKATFATELAKPAQKGKHAEFSSGVVTAMVSAMRHMFDFRGMGAVDEYLDNLVGYPSGTGHPIDVMKNQFRSVWENNGGSRLYPLQYAVHQSIKRLNEGTVDRIRKG